MKSYWMGTVAAVMLGAAVGCGGGESTAPEAPEAEAEAPADPAAEAEGSGEEAAPEAEGSGAE